MKRVALLALLAALLASACAPRVAPRTAVDAPRFPDFPFPAAPVELAGQSVVERHVGAWQYLQAGEFRAAERGFIIALRDAPGFYPAEAGLGWSRIAQRDYREAIERFDRALAQMPAYVPALLGRGQALLALDRQDEALQAFEAAVAADPSLAEARSRIEVLRFHRMQEQVAVARRASESGRHDEARQAYQRALAASPDSAFLYRELAGVEHRQGREAEALRLARRALDLDPNDARAIVLIGGIQEARGDLDAALASYTRARALDPAEVSEARLAALRERAELARLPAEYAAIASAPRVTRADLAALVGIRLGPLLQHAPRQPAVVITDTRDHWASSWIMTAAQTGVMEVYPNHTFQPGAPLRRGELAHAVFRVLHLIAARDPALGRLWQGARPQFTDVSPGHLSYPAAAAAAAAGILPPFDGNSFQLTRPVTGGEAAAAVARLQALAARAR